jgi:hypothetical protein
MSDRESDGLRLSMPANSPPGNRTTLTQFLNAVSGGAAAPSDHPDELQLLIFFLFVLFVIYALDPSPLIGNALGSAAANVFLFFAASHLSSRRQRRSVIISVWLVLATFFVSGFVLNRFLDPTGAAHAIALGTQGSILAGLPLVLWQIDWDTFRGRQRVAAAV